MAARCLRRARLVAGDVLVGEASQIANALYMPLREQIVQLSEEFQRGEQDIAAFVEELQAVSESRPELRPLIVDIINLADKAITAESAVRSANDTISTLGEIAAGQISDVDALNRSLERLANIAMPRLTDSAQARKDYIDGMKAAGSDLAELTKVQRAYDAAMDRISRRKLPGGGAIPVPEEKPVLLGIALPKDKSGSRSSTRKDAGDRFLADLQQIRDRTEALRQEIDMVGLSNEAQTRRRVALDLEQRALADLREEARRKGETDLESIQLSDEKVAAIQREAAAYARTAEELRKAQEANELTRDVAKGFVQDLLNGASAADALSNALGKVADKLLNDVLDAMLQVKGASGGGIISSLLGIAGGAMGGVSPTSPLWRPNTTLGGFLGLAGGGKVNGAGTSTSDSIPAWLSDGEYVVRAAAVQQPGVLAALEAINRGAPRFATGGLVGPRVPSLRNAASPSASSGYVDNSVYNIDARGAQRGVSEEITAAIAAYDRRRKKAFQGGARFG